jgi:DNA-binding XRE family transcriptional regulator
MNKSVAIGVVLFGAGIIVGRATVLLGQPEAPATKTIAAAPSGPVEAGGVLRGQVAEVIQVSQYTYLRLESGEWAAVPSAPSLAVGQTVGISLQNEMVDFTSPSLGRTFARIWFGALEGAAPSAPRAQQPMPSAPSAPPEVQAALQAVGSSNALTLRVVDVFSERKALAGQRVKVAGTVDRVNTVQGVHYVHVKDGTGVAADKTDDLLVLSQVEVAKGANVTAEGVVAIDRDVGMGSVAVLLDQAQVK